MRSIVVSMHTTANGHIEGPNREADWLDEYADEPLSDQQEFLRSVDTILMGRVTYEGLSAVWPTQTGDFADYMNETPKIVFSRQPREVEWGPYDNVRVIHDDIVDEIRRLKAQEGDDMVIFGGAELVKRFTDAGLIDEYRITVDPLLLRGGTQLFDRLETGHDLTLLETKAYDSGTVLLHYRIVEGDESEGGESGEDKSNEDDNG